MPRKYTQKSLLTKPSPSPSHLAAATSTSSQNESKRPTVNDLIRESRRLQLRELLRDEASSLDLCTLSSVPPALRAVFDLPDPPSPPVGRGSHGPSRQRRIPGPPPPKSWLTDSLHAPRGKYNTVNYETRRIQIHDTTLPGGTFPHVRSLQHLVLRRIASDWDWHAGSDDSYLSELPTGMKETLLSYISTYGESGVNPLRTLFPVSISDEELEEVRRLDLGNACGVWTTMKRLTRDLVESRAVLTQGTQWDQQLQSSGDQIRLSQNETVETMESWDQEEIEVGHNINPALEMPRQISTIFPDLRHLSLAVSPNLSSSATWSDLLSLANYLPTLTSLSLAYWPAPTFTPKAAATRVVIKNPSAGSLPGVVYGGSDMYTAFDQNWREAAGILGTLSRSLYCLKWLDLTGCGDWFSALTWMPPDQTERSFGPEWNGSWRSLEHLIIQTGWRPVEPVLDTDTTTISESWNNADERIKYLYRKDVDKYNQTYDTARTVADELRTRRKKAAGLWLNVQLSEKITDSIF